MHSSMTFLEECCTRSSNLKPIITVPKVNLAIRTASSCSRSSSGPPSPRWSTSCWLGPAAPLLRAAPFAFLRCVFCLLVFPLSLVLDLIQFCFVLLGVFDIRSLRTQLPSAHSPTWSFPWVTMETLGLARKRWEAAADSNLFWCDANFLLWCQNSTRYSFKPCISVKKRPPSTDVSNEANLCSLSCSFQRSWLGFPEYLTGNTMQWPVLGLCRCVASSCSPSTGSPWTSGWASGLLLF